MVPFFSYMLVIISELVSLIYGTKSEIYRYTQSCCKTLCHFLSNILFILYLDTRSSVCKFFFFLPSFRPGEARKLTFVKSSHRMDAYDIYIYMYKSTRRTRSRERGSKREKISMFNIAKMAESSREIQLRKQCFP
mgnify:CR=1 FL=1